MKPSKYMERQRLKELNGGKRELNNIMTIVQNSLKGHLSGIEIDHVVMCIDQCESMLKEIESIKSQNSELLFMLKTAIMNLKGIDAPMFNPFIEIAEQAILSATQSKGE